MIETTVPGNAVRSATRTRWAVPLICLAQFIVVLDSSIVNVALPTIGRSLQVGGSNLAWIVDAYVLTFGGLLLLGGRAGDVFGKRRVFLTGVAVFTVASLACGVARDSGVLIAARLLQGAGGALISPSAIALIAVMVPAGPARVRALALYGAMGGLGAMMGEILGGVLTAEASWRWVFGINIPVGLVLLAGAPLVLASSATVRRSLNLPGALVGTAALSTLVYGLIRAGTHGWDDRWAVGGLVAAAVLAGCLVALERTTSEPIVPVRLLRKATTGRACLTYFLVFGFAYPTKFLLTRQFQEVMGYSPLRTGMLFLPAGGAIVIGAMAARRMLPRVGARLLAVTGAAMCVFSALWLTRVTAHVGYLPGLLPALIALGAGFGFAAVANTLLALHNLAPADSGAAAGIFTTSGQIGGALGLAAAASIAATVTTHQLTSGSALRPALAAGFRPAFAVAAGLALLAVITALMRRRAAGAPAAHPV